MSRQKSVVAVWLSLLFLSLSTLRAETKKKGADEKSEKAIQALLVTGGASHDYSVRKEIITRGIRERVSQKIEWMVRFQGDGESDAKIPLFESSVWAEGYDIVVHDYCFPRVKDPEYVDKVLAPHRDGIPAVLIHGTMHSFRTGDSRWFDFCGVTSRRHDENYPLTIKPEMPLNSIWGGLESWMTPAGQLYFIDALSKDTKVLGTALARETKEEHAVVWQHRYGPAGARVFGITPGNDLSTLVQPEYLDVLARGFLWALEKTSDEDFKPVAPESSLSGFMLPVNPPDLPAVGARALGFKSVSVLMPDETIASSPWTGNQAVDRDSGTSWKPEKAGPVTWQGEINGDARVSALAIVWDHPPAEYSLSTSVDGFAWDSVAAGGFKGETLTVLHEMPERSAKWVRVDLLSRGGMSPSGIREVGAYSKTADVPAAFRVGTHSGDFADSAGDALLSRDDHRMENEFLLHRDWSLDAMVSIPKDLVVKSITTQSTDSAFLLASSGAGDDAVSKVLHCQKRGDEVKLSVFLDDLAPGSMIAWDGEWLFVFDGSTMEQYRGPGGARPADEKHSAGILFSEALNDQTVPVNRVFHDMVVAPDGWIYSSFSQDRGCEAFSRSGKVLELPRHGILRFTRELTHPQLVVASKSKIKSYLVDDESIKVVSGAPFEGLYELPPIAAGLSSLVPLSGPVPEGLARSSSEAAWMGSFGAALFEVEQKDSGQNRTAVASIPGLQQFSLDGLNNVWFLRQREEGQGSQLGVLSQSEKFSAFDLDRVATVELVGFLGKGTDQQREAAFFELLRRKRIPLSEIEALLDLPEKEGREIKLALRLLVEVDRGTALRRLIEFSYAEDPELRGLAFELLGNVSAATNHEVFSRIGEETVPSVTAAILAGIYWSGSHTPELNRLVLKLAATPEAEVAEAAVAFLIRREAAATCFAALDDPEQSDQWAAAFKVLSQSRRRTVAEGLGDRLAHTRDPQFRAQCLAALCRMHGAASGETWEGSSFVGSLLRASLSDHRVDKPRLLDQMIAHQIPFPLAPIVKLAEDDLSLEPFVVDRLMRAPVPTEIVPWLREIRKSKSRDPILKRKALIALAGVEDGATYLSLFKSVAEALDEEARPGDHNELLEWRWRENPIRAKVVGELIKKTKGPDLKESRLAWEPLLLMRDDLKGGESEVQVIVKRIDEVLSTKQTDIRPMLLAMKRVSSFELPRALAVIGSGTDASLKQFVIENEISDVAPKKWSASFARSEIDSFLAEARSHAGDALAGYEWFKRAGCAACHNIHGEGPSLGPDFSFRTSTFDWASLFESISDPSAKVTDAFVLHTFEMKEGTRILGANVSRVGEQISLTDTAGNRVDFSTAGIHREWVQGDSLMPPLGSAAMTSHDFADLKAFLDSLVSPVFTSGEVR